MLQGRAFLLLVLLAVTVSAVFAAEQEEKQKAKPAIDQKAMMEMMRLATPGEGHKKLDVLVGNWQTKNTMWMEPGGQPLVSEGTSENKWVLGGRFLEQRFEGTLMNMPFSALGYMGFDNYKRQYVAVAMGTVGTWMLLVTGAFDASGKVLTATGKMDNFATGKVATIRETVTFISDDELMAEMWVPAPDDKEFRTMEVRYTRKK